MNSSTSYKVLNNFACLLVGEPKSGHSSIAMSFPTPWFLDLDRNLSSVIRRSANKPFFFDQLQATEPLKYFDELESLIKAAAANPEVQTLVIDSVSSLSLILTQYILARLQAIGAKFREDTIDKQLRIQDYQTLFTHVLRLVALCRSSGKYVIWTAHQKADKDEGTGILRYEVQIPGSLKSNLGSYFTDVWAVTSQAQPGGKVKYSIRTKPTGYHINLGASFPIDSEVDVTDKDPTQVWNILAPKLGAK